MTLPIIPKKLFDVKSKYLPKGKISLSPFTVGLETLLLQVKDSEDEQEKMAAVKQVVQSCIETPAVNAGSLPIFLVEEIFVRLRQHSVGELVDQSYQCTNEKEDGTPCGKVMPIQIDLREFKLVESKEAHTNTIIVSDPVGIKFRYPSIDLFEDAGTSTDDEVESIISCIESIFDSDTVYPADEQPREDLRNFWDQMTLLGKKEVFDKFFYSMPHMHYKKTFKCPSCGFEHDIEFNSIKDVFQ